MVVEHENAIDCYDKWPEPAVIISDGAYGVGGFPTDCGNNSDLPDWYGNHIEKWADHSGPQTTLWFWNTEIGWAEVHPVLKENGWEYRSANVWNKGIQHVSGNTNTETIQKFPVVTELCVQYVRSKEAVLGLEDDERGVQRWMRDEWKRAGLSFQEANDACDVASAATRKWFAADDKWYFPPPDQFERLREYANRHGFEGGKPYLGDEGVADRVSEPTFNCPVGVTNVWDHPPLHGDERIELPSGVSHPNQKPIGLMERIIRASSNHGDVVWEPFGGLCTASVAAKRMGRKQFAAEIEAGYVKKSKERLSEVSQTYGP